ncbi:MAG: T9SS type A sorting domain-containing protein [Fibrobacterota bacterium]
MIRTITTVLCLAVTLVYSYEPIPPAQDNPGGLDAANIPLFISLGFDDNKYADGVDWIREELLKDRFNNEGTGNAATFDGTPMQTDIYVIGNADYAWSEDPYNQEMPTDRPVTESWRKAYLSGMGVNNHTWTHGHNLSDLSYSEGTDQSPSLLKELGMCSQYLVNIAGMPVSHIYGFRTPYLASSASNNASFRATRDLGMYYDCTLDNGMQGNQPAEWARAYFPGTMEDGWIWWTAMATDRLWQVPNAIYQTQEGGKFSVKGFDSGTTNGWPSGASAQDMFNQMKWAIQYNYNRNRAPLDLGLHSDYYSETAQNTSGTAASEFSTGLADRRKALTMLLDWIEDSLPDARVVTKIDIIRWMENPVALDDLSRNDELTFRTDNGSGGFSGARPLVDDAGSQAELTGENSVDVTVGDPKDWAVTGYAGLSWPLSKSMEEVHSMRLSYSSDIPLRIVLKQNGLEMDSYGWGLPSTDGTTRTVELPVVTDFFEQPRPVDPADESPLDLSAVNEIALVAQVFDTTMSGSFTADMECFGAGKLTETTATLGETGKTGSALRIQTQGSTLTVTTGQKAPAQVQLYDLRGRLVQKKSFSAGAQKEITLRNLSRGTYLLRVSGPSQSLVRRVTLQ